VVGRLVRLSWRRESPRLDDHAVGRECRNARTTVLEHEDGVGRDDLDSANQTEFAGAVALATDASDPLATWIVDPDLRGALIGNDDTAVRQACDSSHAMKLSLRGAIDGADGGHGCGADPPCVSRRPYRSR
jgi:hypothetical protein